MAENELSGIFLYFNNIDIVRSLVGAGKDRCQVYDAIFDFVRFGKNPEFNNKKLDSVFNLLLPLLQSVKRKGLIANKKLERFGERRLKKFDNYIEKNYSANREDFEKDNSEEFLNDHNENTIKNISENKNKNKNKEREIYKERESAGDYFDIPTLDDIKNFVAENGLTVESEIFFHFYNGKRWLINGEPFDWREKILEWVARGAGQKIEVQSLQTKDSKMGALNSKNPKPAYERDFSNAKFDHLFSDLDDIEP